MKKAWKKLLAWVLPCTLLITGTGFPSAVADDAGEVSRKVILSTDFEDETADPWQAGLDGVYAAYSFTDQAKNGQKALKAERKSGQLSTGPRHSCCVKTDNSKKDAFMIFRSGSKRTPHPR